jgi:glucose-1-phosphatase
VRRTQFRAIIFDIGRVLIRVDIARATAGLGRSPSLSAEEVWSAIEQDPRWLDWQEGRLTPREWHLHLAKRLSGSLTFEQFTELWNRALDPEPIQDNALLEKLSERYRLALLSNTDPIHITHAESAYDFFRLFPVRIYSCRVGASKPSPILFREALRACRVHAEEALYIDDVPAYVQAAQRLQMSGITFVSTEQLKKDLLELGVEFE